MIALWILLGILGLLIAVLLIRTLLFTPKSKPVTQAPEITFDSQAPIHALQKLVQCKTISSNDPAQEDDAEFQKLIDLLPELYPNVFRVCQFRQLPDRGLLFHWKGQEAGDASVLMAHYDVVPVDEAKWDKPPFSGEIENGVMWGRGTLDTKATMNGALSAAEHLIKNGFTPKKDVYFAFSGGEEVNGKGARNIVDYFRSQNIRLSMVVDEGGAVVENVFPGVKAPCGLIGIAEKGMMNVRYSVRSNGGHASAPLPKTPITTLATACRRIVDNPFPMHLSAPAAKMFDTLGRYSGFGLRLVFANLWLFKPVLNMICKRSGGEMNALVRTTTAFTMMQGSTARNVIPTEAELISNMRLSPEDSVAGAKAYLEKTVNDADVTLEVLESFEPSPISRTDCEGWERVSAAVANTWPGCIVAPYLMVQCSDSRHYGVISDRVYRFSAMDLTSEERKTIHGNNERIRLESILKATEFYIRLLQNS